MFQNQVFVNPAQAVAGDFASSNPMIYKLSSTGLMVAGPAGVTVGKFCALNQGGTVTSVPGAAPSSSSRIGFVHRENNAQITTYLAESGMTIQPGQAVAAFGSGDFYVIADQVIGTPSRGAAIMWDTTNGNTCVGVTATATVIDTGYVMISESVTGGATIIISNTGA